MLKNAYFLEKLKNCFSVTSAYYYSFVMFISRGKCVLLPSKKNKILRNYSKICSVFASTAAFSPIFTSNSVLFVDSGCKNMSCPRVQGTLATPLLPTCAKCPLPQVRADAL